MASIIKADTLQSTTSNVFVLNSAGTEYARFDSTGNMGIGTASPDSKLHILNSAGASLRVGYLGGNTNYYDATTHTFRSANGSPSSFISNQYGIGLASTVPSSGVGIAFPSTQTASSDANTLDDYEEGTWTPTVTSETGTITAYTSEGTYTKIGNTVNVMFYVNLTTVGTAGGRMFIDGFPFTANYSVGNIQAGSISRESNSTGYIYFGYVTGASTNGVIGSETAGAVAWQNAYKYSLVITYRTT
jgi:hypothetical protein